MPAAAVALACLRDADVGGADAHMLANPAPMETWMRAGRVALARQREAVHGEGGRRRRREG